MKHVCTFILIVLSTSNAYAQRNCYFKLDTGKILHNKNLDFYINKMKSSTFTMGNNKNKIPNYIREQFTCLFGDSLLANPGEVWNSSDVISDGDITRQLIFFAQSKDVFIMVYEGGGWGSSTHMIFMRFLDKRLIDLWCGTNGYIDATYKFNSVKDILSFVQKNKHTKWAFNTNFVYY